MANETITGTERLYDFTWSIPKPTPPISFSQVRVRLTLRQKQPKQRNQNKEMKKSTKFMLSAVIAAGLTMATIPQASASGGTGYDHGYFWTLYYSGGSASISFPSANQWAGNFAISWSGVNDVVGGKGWNAGGYRTIGYNCGYITGETFFGVYGWTTSPLVEYYICEMGNVANGSYKGSVYSDGHNYNIYEHTQYNQPSIQGTATFNQYLDQWGGSSTGSNHQVTTGNHFNAWASHGMPLGNFNYQVLAVESYGGRSGYCNATVW